MEKKKSRIVLLGLFLGCLMMSYSDSVSAQDMDSLIEQSRQNMKEIGWAIEELIKDKGVMLVDLNDDDNLVCMDRLTQVFLETNPDAGMRTRLDVLRPLVALGYLDEIPADPFAPVDLFPNQGENEYRKCEPLTYLYIDNEPDLFMDDFFWAFIDSTHTLQDGEWVLVGYYPSESGGVAESYQYPANSDHVLFLFSTELRSAVESWEIYR